MVQFYLQDVQNKQHEATLRANQPGLAAPAVTDTNKKEMTCRQMAKMGKCSRGDKCPFGHSVVGPTKRSPSPSRKGKGKGKKGVPSHRKPDASTTQRRTESGSASTPACRNWKKGPAHVETNATSTTSQAADFTQTVVEEKHVSSRMPKPHQNQPPQKRKERWRCQKAPWQVLPYECHLTSIRRLVWRG